MQEIHTSQSRFTIYPEHGMQWGSLEFYHRRRREWIDTLAGWSPGDAIFGSGSFLMFPWVNRLEDPPYFSEEFTRDGRGVPLHGLVHSRSWEILESSGSRISLGLEWKGRKIDKSRDYFFLQADYILTETDLSVSLSIHNQGMNRSRHGVGFHPYFRLSGKLDSISLEIPGSEWIQLDSVSLLPISDSLGRILVNNFITNRTICLKNNTLDDLFRQKKGLNLFFKDVSTGYELRFLSEGKDTERYQYCQIYTPSHGKSIAIEPMNSFGNSYRFLGEDENVLEPGEKKILKFRIYFLEGDVE